MISLLLLVLILCSALCVFYTQASSLFPVEDVISNIPADNVKPENVQSSSRRPREKSSMWQQEYPISPHRNAFSEEYSPYFASRRERRVLRNIINAGVHKMGLRHQRRMNERESAKTSDDSFSPSGKGIPDLDASGYFSDVSEPFELYATDDSFSQLDSAPFLSEDEGEYSQYPIMDIGGDFDDSGLDAEGRPVTPLSAHQRRMQKFERRNTGSPSKVIEVIERGSDKTIHGRRRERLRRQRSRGLQKSTGAVPRKLSFSPYHRPSRQQREQSEASLELPRVFDALPERLQKVDTNNHQRKKKQEQSEASPELPRVFDTLFERSHKVDANIPLRKKNQERSDEVDDIGVQSVKNYAARINSRLRNEQ